MVCSVRAASVSSRRRLFVARLPPTPLAVLDLSQRGEREAHDFVRRFSSGRASCWLSHPSVDATRNEVQRRCATTPGAGDAP